MTKTKLYAIVGFSKEGYFRTFATGFSKREINKIAHRENLEGLLIYMMKESVFLKKMPTKYLESYYWKFSKNPSDLKDVLEALIDSSSSSPEDMVYIYNTKPIKTK